MQVQALRNVAIIAHVDHGKTTLVDKLLYQSGMFRNEELDKLVGGEAGLIMDSNPIERERGITILSKNCSVRYQALDGSEYKINIIDTPGHADFGGEVERVLKMADGVLLLVDAAEGPMPQTRYVLSKALGHGLKPIVVINKVDRSDARVANVLDEVFDLFVSLNAGDEALDFPTLYASGRDGWATDKLGETGTDLRVVFETIIKYLPQPENDPNATARMLVTTLDYSDYVGRIAVGRVYSGRFEEGKPVAVIRRNGQVLKQKILQIHQFEGLAKRQVPFAVAGDVCSILGLDPIDIGDTIADIDHPDPLPPIHIDEPTLRMVFRVNDGPWAGRDGTYVTSRQIRDRLEKELQSNVALRVTPGDTAEEFIVSGRGLLHLGILLENMRREGFELCAGRPKVIFKTVDGKQHEPVERLAVECPTDCQSAVMGLVGERRGEIISLDEKAGSGGYIHMEFSIPARGLIDLRTRLLNATRGKAIMYNSFLEYQPYRGPIPERAAGVMITTETARVTAYALDGMYDRGSFFVANGDYVYEGQLVGEHCKDDDIDVNVTRAKHLTNVRASGKEEAMRVRPPRILSLEQALEYIQDDELVEITPKFIRMRKRILTKTARRCAQRARSSGNPANPT